MCIVFVGVCVCIVYVYHPTVRLVAPKSHLLFVCACIFVYICSAQAFLRDHCQDHEHLHKNEIRDPDNDLATGMGLDVHTNVVNHIMMYNNKENSPQWYEESYSRLKAWIDACLDDYQVSLRMYTSSFLF